MNRKTKILGTAAAVVGLTTAGASIAAASGGGDDDATDTPIAGTDLDRASAAALAHTGEGRVTGTEVGDEESFYEVEVTLDSGGQVDVQLDEQFNVVTSDAEPDSESEG